MAYGACRSTKNMACPVARHVGTLRREFVREDKERRYSLAHSPILFDELRDM